MTEPDTQETVDAIAEKPKPARKHPFAPFHEEILAKIIAPRIAQTVAAGGGTVTNRGELHRKFNEQHGTTVSYTTFSDWCEELNIKFETRIHVDIPGYKQQRLSIPEYGMLSSPTSMTPPEFDDPASFAFDNAPRQSAGVSTQFAMGERDILPGGIPAPVMMDQVYGNQ